ncbi:hypothetical protein [Thalassospira australica]|uniref:hypothetical protein n=1 Tax=Thalassospira australica TaxID=1528106 RepID=UPI00384ADB05
MKRTLAILGIMSLSACAPPVADLYLQVTTQPQLIAQTEKDAVSRAEPKSMKEGFFPRYHEISAQSPIIQRDGYLSNYEVFKANFEAGQNIMMFVASQCDCLGFDKRVLVPDISFLDEKGEPENATVEGVSLGLNFFVTLRTNIERDGNYYLLVGANNASVGKEAPNKNATAPLYSGQSASLSTSTTPNPFGEVSVTYFIDD